MPAKSSPKGQVTSSAHVIGTAGHVDHGKSTLVQALTGIDPDRLREEKVRGLTIDLGFAWLSLPSGREVSIVDVPGHERFIKNMLAGAGGIDLALLVIAADEGPMPQTREHLAILELLDIPAAVVVLTKADLVEPEYLDLVEAELDDTLKGSRFAASPRLRVSAVTGAGLDSLEAAIDHALDQTPAKRDLHRPRLPIDRAFTVQGFGTVVTGTLLDGVLQSGQDVELQPGGLRGRIRGLQRHRTKVSHLDPGTRAAVNVSGIHAEEVSRGMVLSTPGTLGLVHAVDVRLTAPAILTHPLAHDAGVTFLSATAESEAKLRLLDCEALKPGETAWAQVVLNDPVAVLTGDHCIVRTSNETAAGGIIVALNPRRHRRNAAGTIASLERQLAGSPAERLADLLLGGPMSSEQARDVLGLEPNLFDAAIADLAGAGALSVQNGRLVSSTWLGAAVDRLENAVRDYFDANPLRATAPREHVRGSARLDPDAFELALSESIVTSRLQEQPARGITLPGYRPQLSAHQQQAVDAFLEALESGRFSPPTENLPEPGLIAYLAEQRRIIDTGAGIIFAAAIFDEMVEMVRRHIAAAGSITLAETRDLFGTSRKYAQAFLEHLDALRITRREGDIRVLR